MSNHKLKLITTEDGSHSLLREDINETYHSLHGAKGESVYVFINQGMDYLLEMHRRDAYRVLELGYGTGLNALLTALFAATKKVEVIYHTLEPFPVPEEIFAKLNYGETDEEKSLLRELNHAEWGLPVQISPYLELVKFEVPLEEFTTEERYDIIFFDAFAPSKQAEIWSPENLEKCFALLNPGGILTTYCAQGQFKRNLITTGFEVQTLPGAMGKKEMVRGIKS